MKISTQIHEQDIVVSENLTEAKLTAYFRHLEDTPSMNGKAKSTSYVRTIGRSLSIAVIAMGCPSADPLETTSLKEKVNGWTKSCEEALAKKGQIRSLTERNSLPDPIPILKNRVDHLRQHSPLHWMVRRPDAAYYARTGLPCTGLPRAQ